jgi:GH15 family glucan-1,4-alpha-glucosidase
VGNGAWNQRQIDVYGELLGAAAQLSEHIGTIDEDTRRFLIACAETAATSWTQKDRGIWEVRGNPQHFVYSKVMCWAALDRGIAMADLLHVADRVDGWKRQREEIWNIIARARPGVRKRALSRNTSGRPPWMPPT